MRGSAIRAGRSSWPRRAIAKAPKADEIWNTLGVAHYRAGAWDNAIEALSRSTELNSGGSPADWLFLAMAYWRKGVKDKARSWFDKAVDQMAKDKSENEELRRFREEAVALLGVTEQPKPNGKKEEAKPRPSKS